MVTESVPIHKTHSLCNNTWWGVCTCVHVECNGLGFRVSGLGFRVQGLGIGFRYRVWVPAGLFVAAVEVVAGEVATVVAVDDAVGIEHGEDAKLERLSQRLGFGRSLSEREENACRYVTRTLC